MNCAQSVGTLSFALLSVLLLLRIRPAQLRTVAEYEVWLAPSPDRIFRLAPPLRQTEDGSMRMSCSQQSIGPGAKSAKGAAGVTEGFGRLAILSLMIGEMRPKCPR